MFRENSINKMEFSLIADSGSGINGKNGSMEFYLIREGGHGLPGERGDRSLVWRVESESVESRV